jgi:2-dehydro-3-deoxyphosphogluconate aldolase/(4S)-4-hydroxy-2-oxoglutarate aldolase
MDIKRFQKLPIMGILRGVEAEAMPALVESVIKSGLETIEITMNTDNPSECIQKTVKAASGRLMVGAGTVLSIKSMHQALDAGASFIVMPNFNQDIVEYCVKNSIPVFPGALTPQEVYQAHQAGATMVKVFPAGLFGPKYFKELKGPFDKVKLLAVGGVRLHTVKKFFKCKADGVAVGASIFNLDQIHAGDFERIKDNLSALVNEVKSLTACLSKSKLKI